MILDSLTKAILDMLEVKKDDKVTVTVEREETFLHGVKVFINKTEHEVSIKYKTPEEFNSELPIYQQYFTERGAVLADMH